MAIAKRLKWFLDSHAVSYELIHHAVSATSIEAARSASVPRGKVAKCVLLEDERGYLLAVLPASCRLNLAEVQEQLHREMELAGEAELGDLFADCAFGAVPPIGSPYGLRTLVDDSLLRMPDVYFEGGDHEELVHLSGSAFRALLGNAQHGRFSRPN